MRYLLYLFSTLFLLLSALCVQAQIEVKITYNPDWIILEPTPDVITTTDERTWKSLNRKNYPSCLNRGDSYMFNWFATQAKDVKLAPTGYRLATETDFKKYSSQLKNPSAYFFWLATPSDTELGQQIFFSSSRWQFRNMPKYSPASVAVLEEYHTYLKRWAADKNYASLNNTTENSAYELDQRTKTYLLEKQDQLMKGEQSFSFTLKGDVLFEPDKATLGLIQTQTGDFDMGSIFNDSLKSIIALWAQKSYPYTKAENNVEVRIPVIHEIDISIFKDVTKKSENSIDYYTFGNTNAERITDQLGSMPVKFIVESKSLSIKVGNELTVNKNYHSLNKIKTDGFRTFKKFLPLRRFDDAPIWKITYIGSTVGLLTSYALKRMFYNRYLKNPYERNGAYFFANNSHRLMLLSGLTLGTTLIIDISKGISEFRNLKKAIFEINFRLN